MNFKKYIIEIIILILTYPANGNTKTQTENNNMRKLQDYYQIKVKLPSFGNSKPIIYDGKIIAFNSKIFIYEQEGDSKNIADCSKNSSSYVNCNVNKVTLLIEISKDILSLENLFSGSGASEIIFEESWSNNKINKAKKMFYDCKTLQSVDLSFFYTKYVTDMSSMFAGCIALTSLDIRNFDTSTVTTMDSMFSMCSSLISLDLSNFDTRSVGNMIAMFSNCKSLTYLDIRNFDTSSVTTMNSIFNNCKALKYVRLENLNTLLVTNLGNMFNGCISLISLDLSYFKTSNLNKAINMFYNCTNLKVINMFNFDTSLLSSTDNYKNFLTLTDSLIYCKFNTYDSNKITMYKACSTFLGFQHCPTCINDNKQEYCEATVCGETLKFLYLSTEKDITDPNEKQCYYFEYINEYKEEYLFPENVTGNIECNIIGELNITLCKKCNNLLKYYQLEKDILKDEFECYRLEDFKSIDDKYFININNNIDKCDISCKDCIGIGTNCTECDNNNGYYHLIDDNNSCYNEDTKPNNYYFNSAELIFKKCHNDCKECNGDPNINSNNCLSCVNISKILEDGNCNDHINDNNTTNITNITDITNITNITNITDITNTTNNTDITNTTNITDITNTTNITDITNTTNITDITNTTNITDIDNYKSNIKCLLYDDYFKISKLCIKCNKNNGYYPLEDKINEKYKDCFTINPGVSKYYFDSISESFKKCYSTCEKCDGFGNDNNQKCIKCIKNYIKLSDSVSNCVQKCPYFYYLSETNCPSYICTKYSICPLEANLIIYEKEKCVNDCTKDDEYKYQYDSNCLKICPENTKPNSLFICIEKEQKCITNINKIYLDFEFLNDENIKILVINYAKEFNYTNNHISIFNNDNYQIIIYKNYECLKNSNISRINMEACLINNKLNDIIIVIINIYRTGNNFFVYNIYNAQNYEKIKITDICKDYILKEKNILEIMKKNKTIMKHLLDQKINVYDSKAPFYNDLCFHFDSINGKDVPLKDRIKEFFPNITLCEEKCENIGINFTNKMAICKCTPEEKKLNDIIDNPIISLEEFDIIGESNIEVLKCYKDFFDSEYIVKNIGFFFALFLLSVQIVCSLLLVSFGMPKIQTFLIDINLKFTDILKNKNKLNSKKNLNELNIKKNKRNSTKSVDIKKIRKSKDIKSSIGNINENEKSYSLKNKSAKKYRSSSNIIKNENINNLNVKGKKKNYKPSKFINNRNLDEPPKKKNLVKNQKISLENVKMNSKNLSSNRVIISNERNIDNDNNPFNFEPSQIEKKNYKKSNDMTSNNINFINEKEINTIIEENYDEMDYNHMIIKDQRTFYEMFTDKLKDNQDLITIFAENKLIPLSLKLVLLTIKIDFYFLVNGLMFNETYISELYYSDKQDTFFSFLTRSFSRIIYSSIVSIIVNFLIDCFFPEEKEVRQIIVDSVQNKSNIKEIEYNFKVFYQKIKRNYIIFIVITYIITLFSWYYMTCFNNVYPNTKYEWLKSSITIFIIMQIILIFFCLIYSVSRFLSRKWKMERLFKISQNFD